MLNKNHNLNMTEEETIIVMQKRTVMGVGRTENMVEILEMYQEYLDYIHRKHTSSGKVPTIPTAMQDEVNQFLSKYDGKIPQQHKYPMIFSYHTVKSYAINPDDTKKISIIIPSKEVRRGIQIDVECEVPLYPNEKIETIQIYIGDNIIVYLVTVRFDFVQVDREKK